MVFGTLCSHYTVKNDPNKLRLLFVGDSVTARGTSVQTNESLVNITRYSLGYKANSTAYHYHEKWL
jgi:hypothetical protein